MGGHFDAVGFGDPELGFPATHEHLRAAITEGRRVGETDEFTYYELETPEGPGLTAATDRAGFLLNGCPHFRGQYWQRVDVEALLPWEAAEPHQGGARGQLPCAFEDGPEPLTFALPRFALEAAASRLGPRQVNLVGLGYRAISYSGDRRLPSDGRAPCYFQSATARRDLPAIRRSNLDCRGSIERAALLTNSRTGARLAYALLNCGSARFEVVIDLPSLLGGLAEGAYLEGSFWLVGRPESEPH